MERIATLTFLLLQCILIQAQDIEFDQGNWRANELNYQRRSIVTIENSERVDSVYSENLATGELELAIQKYPLARYEYYLFDEQFPPLRRRIDIRQENRVDSTYVENLDGTMELVVQKFVLDIPKGAYHEFFPNGNIRIMGTLDGYNDDGTLRKTGEWREWDASEKVIRQETFP